MWINVKVLGRIYSTCHQVAVLPNIVDLSSRKAEVQIYRRSASRLTAVYGRPVKKRGFESIPFDIFFLLKFQKNF